MKVEMICCQVNDFNEIRNWLLFIVAIIGAFITIRTYINATKQRRIDNTYKTLDFLRLHVGKNQISTFIDLFYANSELRGAKYNEFKFIEGKVDTIETMFSEGGCGNGDIHNIIEIFNLLSSTFNKLEEEIIWYEYGQIMIGIYKWTSYLEVELNKTPDYQVDFYLNFNRYMKKRANKMLSVPTKHHTYAE